MNKTCFVKRRYRLLKTEINRRLARDGLNVADKYKRNEITAQRRNRWSLFLCKKTAIRLVHLV